MLHFIVKLIFAFFKRNYGLIIFFQFMGLYIDVLCYIQPPHSIWVLFITPIVLLIVNVIIDFVVYKD